MDRGLAFALLTLLTLPGGVRAEPLDCALEDGLSRAASELLLEGTRPAPGALDRALREADSDAVRARALLVSGDDSARARDWIASQQRSADAPLVCGEAVGSAGRMLVATARGGSLDPVPPGARHIRGRLTPGFGDPQLVVSEGDGSLSRIDVTAAELARGIPIASDMVLPATVQLVATGRAGPRPVAERVLSDAGPDDEEALGPARQSDAPIARQLDDLREEAGMPPVRENRLLAAAAEKHAQLVCATGKVVHEIERGADPKQRLRRAGIDARRVGETVARARDEGGALSALLRSPSHRMTLLEKGFTDAGVGTARDRAGKTCLVVLLASWPRYVGL